MPPPLPVTSLGPVACGAVVWRFRGGLRVTVAVKATFSLVPGGVATLRAPVDLVLRDVSFDRDPSMSLERAGELVPFRARADITFVGHAYAPPGQAVPAMSVRLAVHRDRPLVEKTLHVFGDRHPAAPGTPSPFPRMPIRYERAYGGPSFEANPVGRGAEAAAPAAPNVVDVTDPRRPAGFGPLAAHWLARRRLLGSLARSALEAPIVEIPDDVAWDWFQAAPADQQAPYLHGDEWIVLDGLHPALPRVQTQLPSARGVARVYLDGRTSDVELQADTLAIDGDTQSCSVVWRGRFALSGEGALASARIVGGLEMPGHPVAWPEAALPVVRRPPAHLASTSGLSDEAQLAMGLKRAVPFSPAATGDTLLPPPAVTAGVPRPPSRLAGTAGLSFGEHRAAGRKAATPFEWENEAPLDGPTVGALPPPTPETETEAQRRAPAEAAASPGGPIACPPRRTPAIPVFNRTPFALVTIPWQVSPPRDSRTVFVKGTFDLVPGGPARAREEAELPGGDVHHGGDPGKSLAYPSDFAIFKPRADVTLVGSARGGAMGMTQVSFAFGHAGNRFERRLAVFGERRWRGGIGVTEPGPPEPFDTIPLVHERAFGGARCDDNPLGVGHPGSPAEPPRLPNLEDPAHLITSPRDTPPPACFGPIRVDWKERRSRLGTYDGGWLETRWPYFPEDFEWTYFQAAPRAQQLAYLGGDEPFEIVGMHRDHATLRGTLPGLRLRCALEEEGGSVREVALRLDTASFDVDAMKLTLVWRGVLEVRDDEATEIAALMLTSEAMAQPPATLEQVRAACLAATRIEPVAEPAAPPPANDAAPAEDPEEARLKAELEARLAAAREQLDKAGVRLPDPLTSVPATPPEPPPLPDPEALAAKLRASGAGDKEVGQLLEALRAAGEAREAGQQEPPAPSDVRARVVAMLAAGEPFNGMDLAGADLAGLDFGGRSLGRANLKGARLTGCNFAAADLSFAQLGGVDLVKATLEGANLDGADLHGASLEGAVFEDAAVAGASFAEARGEGASFRGAKGASAVFADGAWKRARFDDAALPAADFSRAALDGASFVRAAMPEVRLFDVKGVGACFDGAAMPGARADDCSLTESSFQGADASRSTWEKATLDGSSFRAARLARASFVRASCSRAVFSAAELVEGRFSRARLVDAQFLKANLMKATFDRADLTRADLRASNLHAAETWRAKLDGAQLELAIVTGSKLARRS